jgi:hypothetical protein
MNQRSPTSRSSRSGERRAVVTLELILAIPVLLIVLLAVVEVGLILAASKHVEFASRLGAKLAAEATTADLGMLNTTGPLKDEIDEYLTTAGYTASCTVILEHNVAGAALPLQTNPDPAACTCNPDGALPGVVVGPPATVIESVRVTVCLPMDGNIPNCLATFGFDLSDCSIRHSTVWNYEN